ncbi:hypothetical protein [Lysinibacillus fusiformis]|uniref:hypothetical protein n=1 Tax=Lysinibacillus fusiformis TaxID=28031 RepID=UPI00046910D5|nr:hypothetical protein [Lysinibacillus fusiformis]
MTQVIGKVGLSKGRVGYFDELTRIHLTISKPEAFVLVGMNTANLKRAIRSGILRLVTGSLELEQNKVVKNIHVQEVTKAAKTVVEERVVTIDEALVNVNVEEGSTVEPKKKDAANETKTTRRKRKTIKQ